jgi:hypothetical protein
MHQWITRIALAVGFAAILTVPFAYSQSSSLRVNVPFKFGAAGKTFPSGEYSFTKGKPGTVVMTGADSKAATSLTVITSLARSGPSDDHLLAFDKVGSERILSEVWIPGREGALVNASRGEHQHEVVKLAPRSSR